MRCAAQEWLPIAPQRKIVLGEINRLLGKPVHFMLLRQEIRRFSHSCGD
jgi:hypothetical protein